MHTLTDMLRAQSLARTPLGDIVHALADAARYINAAIRMRDTFKDGDTNASGDTQSALDVTADRIFTDALRASGVVRTIASEERDDVLTIDDAQADYCVAFDPYDGGSVGDANITFGSIVGIWTRDPHAHSDTLGAHICGALAILYGPRVTLWVTLNGARAALFELDEVGTFIHVRNATDIAPRAMHFAPGNLRACNDTPQYKAYIDDCIARNMKLRYSGALVTDVNHILCKGDGVFTYPADARAPHGKLRLFYEGAPLTELLRNAGGCGTDAGGTDILARTLRTTHERTPLFLGSRESVAHAVAALHVA